MALVVMAWASVCAAQTSQLTPSQLDTLKAAILADPALAEIPQTDGGAQEIANALNLNASPDFWVWRTRVSKDEYFQTTSADGTVFAFTGAGYITRSQGERDAWNALFDAAGFANPSLANVRQAVADIFSGNTAPAPANRTHLLTISRRKATRFERLYTTGNGSTASPGLAVVSGPVRPDDVSAARNR
jgi:hypothetical protein